MYLLNVLIFIEQTIRMQMSGILRNRTGCKRMASDGREMCTDISDWVRIDRKQSMRRERQYETAAKAH